MWAVWRGWKLSFSEECSLINIESIMDLENYDFAVPNTITDPGKNHQWMQKSLSDRLGNKIATNSWSIIP